MSRGEALSGARKRVGDGSVIEWLCELEACKMACDGFTDHVLRELAGTCLKLTGDVRGLNKH